MRKIAAYGHGTVDDVGTSSDAPNAMPKAVC
jgi:hypothetical protein